MNCFKRKKKATCFSLLLGAVNKHIAFCRVLMYTTDSNMRDVFLMNANSNDEIY